MDDRGVPLKDHATSRDIYSTLSGKEIRTLLLSPGKEDSPVVCELQVLPSPEYASFEALSYVWGDASKSQFITCNGFKVYIANSLYTALANLRYSDSSRRLWADQLCINQQDEKDELITQLASMGTIYSSATRVIIWLGIPDSKMLLAFDLVQQVSTSSRLDQSDVSRSSPNPTPQSSGDSSVRRASQSLPSSRHPEHASIPGATLSSSVSSETWLSSSHLENNRHSTPVALKYALSIFQHVYFYRKWTFSEIVLAKEAIICCGRMEIPFSNLCSWFSDRRQRLEFSSPLYDSHGPFQSVVNTRKDLDKFGLRLSKLLMLTRHNMSTNPEDAVYALQGLVPDLAEYLKPVSDANGSHGSRENDMLAQDELIFRLYLKVFQYCLEKENDLTILSAAGRYGANVQVPNWPGWLPDWRQQMPLQPLALQSPHDPSRKLANDIEMFDTDLPQPQAPSMPFYKLSLKTESGPWLGKSNSITLHGVCLGCIVNHHGGWPRSYFVADSLAQSLLGYFKGNPSECAFARSLDSLVSSSGSTASNLKQERNLVGQNCYATALVETSLEDGAKCVPVRISVMVESGDWLCAFKGGNVLYAVRPVDQCAHNQPCRDGESNARQQQEVQDSAAKMDSSPSFVKCEVDQAVKCFFLGECTVDNLRPAEVWGKGSREMKFELL